MATPLKDQKLTKTRRIKKRPEFLRIQKSGRKAGSKHFLLVTSPPIGAESRFGVTVTTKVHKRAVRRNLVKRRLKDLFRRHRADFSKPSDIVVIARNGATELSAQETRTEVLGLLVKARLLKKDQVC